MAKKPNKFRGKTERNDRRPVKPEGRGNDTDWRKQNRKEAGMDDTDHKFNDVSWYAKNEQMLRDAASFSYNSPLGSKVPWMEGFRIGQDITGGFLDGTDDTVPGLMQLRFLPTVGLSISSTSPANLAAQNIYSFVRYMNSGAKNYDQADMMLYLMAMDSIYMMWNWAKRIYGYARVYSQKNRYLPDVMFAAEQVNITSVTENLADFRLGLNKLAAQISSFCVPAVMPLFIRHSWMVSNIYKDSDIDKAQMFMFSPAYYYQYNETGSKYGGQLVAKAMKKPGAVDYTYQNILDMIQTALDQVAYSEDIGVMSGDILKAYGQEKLFKLAAVDPDYTVVPVYNEEVLNQIHNSSVINDDGATGLNITQNPNTGFLIWNPTFKETEIVMTRAFVNMPWNDVTPANTMVGTRLVALLGESNNGKAQLTACGSEVIVTRVCWDLDGDPTGATSEQNYNYDVINNILINHVGNTNNNDNLERKMAKLSNFDWHPLVPMFRVTDQSDPEAVTTYKFNGVLGDISNYTIIELWNLQQIHSTAILSEFNVPQIGSY